jgi:hypothetical protein
MATGPAKPVLVGPFLSAEPPGRPFIFSDHLLEYNSNASEPWMVDGNSGHVNAHETPVMIETDPSPAQQLSPEANRMRRSRARRRRGETIVALEVGPALISGLVALGWLPEGDSADKAAIARSLAKIAERALWANVTPSAGSQGYVCFACDLDATTVDTLISLSRMRKKSVYWCKVWGIIRAA